MDLLICARMGSSRLPGKALMEIGDNKNCLDLIIEKVRSSIDIDKIILATTTSNLDNKLEEWSLDKDIEVFRGSEKDVLGRLNEAVNKFKCEDIIEILGDNPLVPIDLITQCVDSYKSLDNGINYLASATSEYNFSKKNNIYPIGIRVQIFNKRFINLLEEKAQTDYEREHSTSYIYDKPDFGKIVLKEPSEIIPEKATKYNLAINTKEQLQTARLIYKQYGLLCNIDDIVSWIDKNA